MKVQIILVLQTFYLVKSQAHILKGDSMLVFTIPYEKGWHIKIDGESVNHSRVLYVLTGVSVQEGEHTIEMRYVPQGIVLGTIISFIALILLISLYLHFGKSVLKE